MIQDDHASYAESYTITRTYDDINGPGTIVRVLPTQSSGKRVSSTSGWGSGEYALEMVRKSAGVITFRVHQIGEATDQSGDIGWVARITTFSTRNKAGSVKNVAGTDNTYNYPLYNKAPLAVIGGKVGIGTANPQSTLDVAGSLSAYSYGWGSTLSQSGQPFYKINELTDVLYRADSRFTVTNGSGNYFDGDYGSNGALPANTTTVININVANQSGVSSGGITYPGGSIYVSFYFDQNQYSSIGLRSKCGGSWYSANSPTNVSTNLGYKVMKFLVPGGCGNYLTDIELSISTDNTNGVWLSEINYVLDRASNETEFPYVSKYNNSNSVFGKFGVSTTSPWRSLSVTGTLALDGLSTGPGAGTLCLSASKEVLYSAGATCTVSSQRFKHDIATSTTGLDLINKLRPVTFFYNDDMGVPGEQYGFIAEEVEQLDPRLVVHDKDNNPFSVKYENMTAILAKAIQEQQTQINQLKASTTGPIIHDSSSLLSDLQYYSNQLLTGIWHFVEIVTDKITATLGVFKRVESDELQTKRFCVGNTCVTEAEFKSLLEKNSISQPEPAKNADAPVVSPTPEAGTGSEVVSDNSTTTTEELTTQSDAGSVASSTDSL